MENLKHPHIAQHIVCPELEAQIKAAFERNIQNGTDFTATRFRQALDSYVSTLISTPKGASALNNNLSDIKAHFCRGRKWVTIPSDHDHHQLAMDTARSNDFDSLIELFEKNNAVHARFHSTSTHGINFSLHPNSSEGSSVKFTVPTEVGMALEVLDGTPKSCGLEGTPKKKKKAEVIETEPEAPVTEETELLSEITGMEFEENTEEAEAEAEEIEVQPSEEQLVNEATSMEEWEQLLADEGIDLDFDEDNFDSFNEEVHA